MSSKISFLEYWYPIAATLCEQAIAGEPKLSEGLPKPLLGGALVFVAEFGQDFTGRFTIMLDRSILSEPLFGEGTDQQGGWQELLKEICDAAAGEIYQRTKKTVQIKSFQVVEAQSSANGAYELRLGTKSWTILVRDQIAEASAAQATQAKPAATSTPAPQPAGQADAGAAAPAGGQSSSTTSAPSNDTALTNRGIELLLDVELEASLRFGSRELPLSEILELGPGDVVHLDRHIADPVDLLIGDKIVARGEVVLVNGNFGLRVTEVAEPQKRLESIRCLF
jgi:flagellar motor switch protein FliN